MQGLTLKDCPKPCLILTFLTDNELEGPYRTWTPRIYHNVPLNENKRSPGSKIRETKPHEGESQHTALENTEKDAATDNHISSEEEENKNGEMCVSVREIQYQFSL